MFGLEMKVPGCCSIAVVLSLMFCACSGCGYRNLPGTTGDEYSRGTAVELVDEFVIGAYPAPPPEQNTSRRYRQIAEAGLDIIIPGIQGKDFAANLELLELGRQAGVCVVVWDERIISLVRSPEAELTEATVEEIVRDYQGHPAFAGYVVWDEPDAAMFARLGQVCQLFRQADPRHEPIVNVFPGYATSKQLGTETFRRYIRRYIETVKPRVLSYDHYPLRVAASSDSGWYRDLEIVRQETRRAGIGFWIFIQSEGIEGYLRIPSRSEIFWQANTALAYGARGILWFTYWTPPAAPVRAGATVEHHVGGMIDSEGNRTKVYEYVQEENKFLRQAGPAVFGWDNRLVARYGNGQRMCGRTEGAVPVGPGFNLVVGTFSKAGRYRLLFVNNSYTEPAEFSIETLDGFEPREVVSQMQARRVDGQWRLGPGGCVLVELRAVEK